MSKTNIEWTDVVWNPVTGCTKISLGCKNCYAEKFAYRLKGRYGYSQNEPFQVTFHEDRLQQPSSKWKKAQRVFVCSMGDLFHKDVKTEWIHQVFRTMWYNPHHTFIILTKRAERMADYIKEYAYRRLFDWSDQGRTPIIYGDIESYFNITMRDECGYTDDPYGKWGCEHPDNDWPEDEEPCNTHSCPIAYEIISMEQCERLGITPDNLGIGEEHIEYSEWMVWQGRPKDVAVANCIYGISASTQKMFDERMKWLRSIKNYLGPHFKTCLSLEPLLEHIDISEAFRKIGWSGSSDPRESNPVDWVIVGGESGQRARPMNPDWVQSIKDQCIEENMPFFFKQWGAWRPWYGDEDDGCPCGNTDEDHEPHECKKVKFWKYTGGGPRGYAPRGVMCSVKVGKKKAGRKIHGKEWNEFPEGE